MILSSDTARVLHVQVCNALPEQHVQWSKLADTDAATYNIDIYP